MASATIVTSIVTGGSSNHSTVSSEANAYATDFVTQGCLGTLGNSNGSAPSTGSFGVSQDASPDMGITITGTGNTTNTESVAYVNCTPATQDIQVLRARMSANYTGYTINANSTGSTVYDWIYLQANTTNANTPDAAADNVINLYTSRSTSNTADNGSPPTYGILLAVVTVVNGASSITNANIADKRTQAVLSIPSTSSNGWTPLGTPLTYSANNGSKEFAATASTDLTSTLSPGMKLQVTRSVSPPTESAVFASASSQYASKSSPSGITFTGNFTVETWIYLTKYPTNAAAIIGRDSAGGALSGWELDVLTTGQLSAYYRNASGNTAFTAYPMLPLDQWVHVAAVATAATPTIAFYVNGALVTAATTATAATSVVQAATNLTIGNRNSATGYLDAYLSETRLWSTAQTQANIQANMTKSLVGNETNLIGLWQFNGAWTDATSNANTLTASGGALNTQAANPYNTIEYFTILAVSYSAPTTTITLDGGTQNTLPNMTLNSPNYSTAAKPFGLPANLKRYVRYVALPSSANTTNTSATQVLGLAITLTIPTGTPKVKITANTGGLYANSGTIPGIMTIWDGVVSGAGTQLMRSLGVSSGSAASGGTVMAVVTPPAGSKTYNIGLHAGGAATATLEGSVTAPAVFMVEVDL